MDIHIPEMHAEVSAVFARYEEVLVHRQTDVPDAVFWSSAFTVRPGAGENLRGIEAVRAFQAARAATGLARKLQQTVITTFGRDAAALTDCTPEGQARTGRQRQTWVRLGAEWWRVVAAQVSLLAA